MRTLVVALSCSLAACGSAEVSLSMENLTGAAPAGTAALVADGTSMRIKMLAVYLAQDVDPVTMNNVGSSAMIWLNPQCHDAERCVVEPPGDVVTDFFDFARPTADVQADLDGQAQTVAPGTYRYVRVDFCKVLNGGTQPSVPTMMWKGPGMAAEQAFTSGDCGRTSQAFDPPLQLGAGDAIEVTLGYDLAQAVVSGAPATDSPHCSNAIEGRHDADGSPHCFRACVDVDASTRDCMDFPDFTPSAARR
jgi:hypothetical protein